MLSFAILNARNVVDQHDFEVINAATDVSLLQVLAPTMEIQADTFESGWSKTRSYGSKYGRKYIQPFKAEIQDMFKLGNDDSMKIKGPGHMLAELRRRYPNRLDLPSESEIRQCISTLMAKQKKGHDTTAASIRGIAEPYFSTVISIFEETPDITPEAAWEKFQAFHPPTEASDSSYHTASKVKSNISGLKSQQKK